MLLTHRVLTDRGYANYYESLQDTYKILDNSLMENRGVAMSVEDVFRAAVRVKAHEVVLPDVFRGYHATRGAILDALFWLAEQDPQGVGSFNLAGVVQGSTPAQLMSCFSWLWDLNYLHTIHIPKVVDTIWPLGRMAFLQFLEREGYLADQHKAVHLLGIWTSPTELYYLSEFKIRSVDTALPAQAAIQGIRFPTYGWVSKEAKPRRPEDFFDVARSPEIADILEYNLHVIDAYANGNWPAETPISKLRDLSAAQSIAAAREVSSTAR